MSISKGSYGYGELKNIITLSVQYMHRPLRDFQLPGFKTGSYRADNGNFGQFGARYPHGTVFALKQCLYPKEATGMESLKM